MTPDNPQIYKFGFGQSPFPVPECMVARLDANKRLKHYSPCQGEERLRESISKWFRRVYALDYHKDQIVVSTGSKFLYFLFQMIFSGEIFLLSPCWVSYKPQCEISNKTPHVIQCKRGRPRRP